MSKDHIIKETLEKLPNVYYAKSIMMMEDALKENNIEYDESLTIYDWAIKFFYIKINNKIIYLHYIIDYEKVKIYVEGAKNYFIKNDNLNIMEIIKQCNSNIIEIFYHKYNDLYNDYVSLQLSML